jgi:hypothetical protein
MKSLLAAALVMHFAVQCGKALAHTSNNNCYVNSSRHVLHSPSSGNVVTALAFRSITAGSARTTAAWRTGNSPLINWRSLGADGGHLRLRPQERPS